jgi:hypothetical protein
VKEMTPHGYRPSERKEAMIAAARDRLNSANLPFTDNSGGIHLVVRAGDVRADLWPTTGRFFVKVGRGRKSWGIGLDAFMAMVATAVPPGDSAAKMMAASNAHFRSI